MNIFKQIGNFFLCLLRDDCPYSIKKFLVWIFTAVTIYLIIFTDKDVYQLLTFILVLLGIRSFEKVKLMNANLRNNAGSGGKQLLND
jgi:hypothetical protein